MTSPSAYSRMFNAAAFPLLDRLNHTTIARKYEELLAGEHLDRARIFRQQETKLAAAIDRARRCEFYARFWKTAAAARRIPSSHAPLDGMPVLTKADLLAAPEAFPLAGAGAVITSRSSGSTGLPMTFYRCREQESWFWALRFRIWHWAGYRPGDPYLTINLNSRQAWQKRLQDVLFRCTYLTYNADNLDAARIVDCLQNNGVQHLNGFASSLYALARYMNERGLRASRLVGITATGDALYPTYRDEIEAAFGLRVLDYYGAGGEGVHLASQCPQSGSRYHVLPENALIEILSDEGPVPAGTLGRVVVTQFDNAAMPLIRYELGDIAAAAPEDAHCACGRTLPLLERVEGRIPDLILAPDGAFLVMHFFVVLFKNLQGVRHYQIVQDELARIRVRLVAHPGANREAVEHSVRRAVGEAARGTLSCDFEWVDEIPLSGAGKRRLVVSRVGRQALGSAGVAA
jgi:phenylacetate-CoA ligase